MRVKQGSSAIPYTIDLKTITYDGMTLKEHARLYGLESLEYSLDCKKEGSDVTESLKPDDSKLNLGILQFVLPSFMFGAIGDTWHLNLKFTGGSVVDYSITEETIITEDRFDGR